MNIILTLTATPEFTNILNKLADAFESIKVQSPKGISIPQQVSQIQTQTIKPQSIQPVQQVQAPVQPQPIQQTQMPVQTAQQPIQANVQTQVPVQPVQQLVPTMPVSTPTYTMDQLAVAATQLIDSGHRIDLVNLLTSFGVQALTALPKEQYGAFATQLRSMGAKI